MKIRHSMTWRSLFVCALAIGAGGCHQDSQVPVAEGERGAVKSPALKVSSETERTPARSLGLSKGAKKKDMAKAAPGQIVVKFKSLGPHGLTQDAQTWIGQGRSFVGATADGSTSLDALVGRYEIRSARPLMRDRAGLSTAAAVARLEARFAKMAAKRGLRARPSSDLANVYRLEFGAAADVEAVAAALRRDPHVEYAQPNYEMRASYTPNDPFLASRGSWGQAEDDLWGLKKLGAEQAWDSARGAGVVVAVVDCGVDFSHPDLAGNRWTNTDEIPGNGIDDDGNGYVDDTYGWNTADDNNDPTDRAGHGTHLAGTIAALGNNGIGIVGVAPEAQIMAVKGLNDAGNGTSFDLAEAILYAGANGAKVINNSWGCVRGCPSNPVVEDAVANVHAAGAVVVFAAGNDNLDVKLYSPQNRPEPIVVSAATPFDQRASFSNFGFVDVGAPGAGNPDAPGVTEPVRGILSLKSAVCIASICPAELIVGDIYLRQAGTSMAAPHVSGLAALVLSQHSDYSAEQVRQVIRHSATDAAAPGFDTDFGYGLASASAAMQEPAPLQALILAPALIQTAVPYALAGTAAGPGFASYLLEFGVGASPASWTAIASSTTAVQSGTLGTWSVGAVPDGEYTLRLTALTQDGRTYSDLALVTLDRVILSAPEPLSVLGGHPFQIVGTAAPAGMRQFAIVVQHLGDGTPLASPKIILTGNGTAPVENGVLAVWDPRRVPADNYRIILQVTTQDGTVSTDSVPVVVDTRIHDGWPIVVDNGGQPIPLMNTGILADLDRDGRDEHIVAYVYQVNVFEQDGTQLAGWPQRVDTNGDPSAVLLDAPAVGDLGGDGSPEVVVASNDGRLWVWNADGTLRAGWPQPLTPGTPHPITLADVDGDGRLEIVLSDGLTMIDVRRADGTSLRGFPVSPGAGLTEAPVVADINRDGKMEIVAALSSGGPYTLVAYSHSGQPLAGFPITVSTVSSPGAFPVVGDLDNDGDLEIVVSAAAFADPNAAVVAAYHRDGRIVAGWPKQISGLQMSPPVLADVDGDGALEVMVGVGDGQRGALYVWNGAGALLPGWPVYTPDTILSTITPFISPIVVDLDRDHRGEIITVRLQDYFLQDPMTPFGHSIQAFRYDATPILDLARPQFGNLPFSHYDISPAVGDTDGDGRLEMVWLEDRTMSTGELLADAWDLGTPAKANVEWRMPRADARRSAVAQTVGRIPTLTDADRDRSRRVSGDARFRITTGGQGIIQIAYDWQQPVKWALGGDPLQPTPYGWGGPMQVQPLRQYVLHVYTPRAMSIRLSWW